MIGRRINISIPWINKGSIKGINYLVLWQMSGFWGLPSVLVLFLNSTLRIVSTRSMCLGWFSCDYVMVESQMMKNTLTFMVCVCVCCIMFWLMIIVKSLIVWSMWGTMVWCNFFLWFSFPKVIKFYSEKEKEEKKFMCVLYEVWRSISASLEVELVYVQGFGKVYLDFSLQVGCNWFLQQYETMSLLNLLITKWKDETPLDFVTSFKTGVV